MDLRKEVLAGIAGGLAGGTIMTVVMTVGKKTGMIPEPLPLMIEHEIEERAGVEEKTSPAQENLLAFGGHYILSAFFGALYGLLRWATGFSPIPSGPLYGLGTYIDNLVGLGPALDLTPSPQASHGWPQSDDARCFWNSDCSCSRKSTPETFSTELN
jgi:hypothetical protein